MTRLLVTGADGQLGRQFVQCALRAGDEVAATGRAELDIANAQHVSQVVADVVPDAIVNCAAWTAVDDCESDPDRANLVNGDAVGYLRAAADQVGAHLVQVSTDYVFDGMRADPYPEDAPTSPMSAYGRSKLIGEQLAGTEASIVRTSWVCGRYGRNMVSLVLDLMNTRPELRFVADQIGNPSFTADLVEPIRQLAVQRRSGVFHLTNSTPGDTGVSWYQFVGDIVELAGGDRTMVHPIATVHLDPPRPAPRPANSVLANTKLEPLRNYREPLAELIDAFARDT